MIESTFETPPLFNSCIRVKKDFSEQTHNLNLIVQLLATTLNIQDREIQQINDLTFCQLQNTENNQF